MGYLIYLAGLAVILFGTRFQSTALMLFCAAGGCAIVAAARWYQVSNRWLALAPASRDLRRARLTESSRHLPRAS
jgi:hypothetical protein